MNENRNIPKLRFPEYIDSWENIAFGSLVQRKSKTQNSSSNLPSVEYDDVEPEIGQLNKDVYSKQTSKKGIEFDDKDVLYGKLRPYLHHWLAPSFKGVATGDWWVLTPKNTDRGFIYSIIQTDEYDAIANQSSGSKMPRSDWNTVARKEFAVPSDIKEQQRIGSFFSKIDSVIALQQQYVDQLKEFKKGCLQKMFPKKGEKVPEMRFPGAYNDKGEWVAFTDDWEQRKWSDSVDISTEMVDPMSGKYDMLPHVAPGNIESFTGRIYDNVKLVKDENLISGKFHFYPGDIIYGKINPQLGKYVFADFEGLTSADAYVLNAKGDISQKFLYAVIQTEDFYKYSVSVSRRSGMPKINRDELNAYNFNAPSFEEQEKIGSILLSLDNLITLHQRKLDEMKEFKKGCLQKMFV